MNVINTLNSERQLVTEASRNPQSLFYNPNSWRNNRKLIHSTGRSLFHLDVVTMVLKSKLKKFDDSVPNALSRVFVCVLTPPHLLIYYCISGSVIHAK